MNLLGYLINSNNPLTAKLFNLNFHPLEVVFRWRDPQLIHNFKWVKIIQI